MSAVSKLSLIILQGVSMLEGADGYVPWVRKMTQVLKLEGVWAVVAPARTASASDVSSGTTSDSASASDVSSGPGTTSKNAEGSERAFALFISKLSDGLFMRIGDKTAREVWQYLHERFGCPTAARLSALEARIQ